MSKPIVVLSPCLDEHEPDALRERMKEQGIDAVLLAAPKDPAQGVAWRTEAVRAFSNARRVLVVEPSLERDPEGLYRRELTTIFAGVTPAARGALVPCSFSRGEEAAESSDARPALAGPWGRPIVDLAKEDALDKLKPILASAAPKPKPLALEDLRSAVLSDHPAARDGIGLEGAASAFVDVIGAESTTPPIVASIEGSWGIGKSSFLGLVRGEIRRRGWANQKDVPSDPRRSDPPGLRTVWVNAWSNDSELSAFSSFALSLIAELEDVNVFTRVCLRLRLMRRRFHWRKGWKDVARLSGGVLLILLAMIGVALWIGIPYFKGWILSEMGSIKAVLAGLIALSGVKGIERLGSFFSSPFDVDLTKHVLDPDHEAKRSPRDLLHDDIAKIIEVYSRDAKRLYVFIDDLDRADPSKVVEIMQTISVLLAKAGDKLVYVLAMDREKVAAAIAAKHKELAALMSSAGAKRAQPLDFGHAFLEKFVQLPFRVPTADVAKLRSWIEGVVPPGQGLGEVVGMVVPFLGANPRRIKQFVNVMHLRLRILKAQDAPAPVFSLHQLGKITAAELLYPFFIDDLIAAPRLLNALLIGAGSAVESESYRRWSAHSELLALLAATLPFDASEPLALLQANRDTSLLDLDLGPILRIVARPVEAIVAPSATAKARPDRDTDLAPGSDETPYAVLVRYANEYERIRATEPGGPSRTAKLDRLFEDMERVRGVSEADVEKLLASGSAGARVAALASFVPLAKLSNFAGQGDLRPYPGPTLLRVLEQPNSMFETYQALRVASQLWRKLSPSDQRAITLLLSERWLTAAFEHDVPTWYLTRTLLNLARDTELEPDIQVLLPDGVAVRLSTAELTNFNELVNMLYSALAPRVRMYHYGTDWRLFDGDTPLVHVRERKGVGPGQPTPDARSLSEAGVRPGSRLRVELLKPPRDTPAPPDASP